MEYLAAEKEFVLDAKALNLLLPIASQTYGVNISSLLNILGSKITSMDTQKSELSTLSQSALLKWLHRMDLQDEDEVLVTTMDFNMDNND